MSKRMSQSSQAPTKATDGGADESTRAQRRSRMLQTLQTGAIAGVLVILIIIFWISSPFFFNVFNFLTIGRSVAILGMMAVTQTFLVMSKGIDISIGSVAALTGVLVGFFFGAGMNIWVSAGLALLIGLGIGILNGLLIVGLDLDPLVVTLGGFSVFSGLAFVISGTKTLVLNNDAFSFVGGGSIFGIPFTLVLFILVFLVAIFVERRMVIGRMIFAIGGSPDAARLAGVRVARIRVTLFALSSLSAAVAGVLLASQLSTSSPNVGAPFLLSVVTAVVLGGTSLDGGRGGLLGTLFAVGILGVLQNGFALLAFSSFAQQIVLGMLLVAAVALDTVSRRRSA